jgi:formylglycine-generating enzyme required for sulfatase activity
MSAGLRVDLAALATLAAGGAGAGEFVRLDGGTFAMGSTEFYGEEGPVRQVTVGPFEIGVTEVTNAEFAAFVAATGIMIR